MKKSNPSTYIISYDKWIFFTYLTLLLVGLYIMLDLSSVRESLEYFYRQLIYSIVSFVVMLFILNRFNLVKLRSLNGFFIIISIVLLVLVLVFGQKVKGATRSINLWVVNFQPSFLARVALVFFFAHIIDKKRIELPQAKLVDFIKKFLPLLLITLAIYVLIYVEKHLSTLIISGMTLTCLLFLGGLRFRIILLGLLLALLCGFIILKAGEKYRGERLAIYEKYCLFFKNTDSKISEDTEYQVKESLTALTSGKFFGTGSGKGRAKHYFLPDARTDFVFTIIGEQYGFLGAIIVFGLHCLLFFRIMLMSYRQQDFYFQLLGMGLGLNLFFNALVNVGVSMSIIPPTGTTLPLISYSGTAMIVDSATVGVILNISAVRKVV